MNLILVRSVLSAKPVKWFFISITSFSFCFSCFQIFFSFTAIVQPSKLYYIHLKLYNFLKSNITLKPSDSQPPDGLNVQGRTIVKINKKLSSPDPITLHAVETISDKMLVLNDQRSISVNPTVF